MMKGRRKKPGQRSTKTGRLSTRADRRSEEDPARTALDTRMRQQSIGRENASHAEWGFPLGRLFKRGYLSKAQYEAGNTFASQARDYLATKPNINPTPGAVDPDRRGASLEDCRPLFAVEMLEYFAALAMVDHYAIGKSSLFLLNEICVREGNEQLSDFDMGTLREGLNAVSRCIQRREKVAKRAA